MLHTLGYLCILGFFLYCCWHLGKLIDEHRDERRSK